VPGAARMYPETDLPLLKISREVINNAKKNIPKLKGDLEEELKGKGLNKEMIKSLFKQNKLDDFKEFLEIVDNPPLIGKIILLFPKEIASHEKIAFSKINKILNKDILIFVLEALENKKISEAQVKNVLVRIVRGEKLEDSILFEKEDTSFIEEKIMKIIKNKPGLSEKAYMGLVMKEFKGKVNGKTAREVIEKYLK
jgi:glutamyl-tRNA(Gln) amidotransferase subunit E